MQRMNPNFEINRSHNHEYGYTVITLWDTTHTEVLDCWKIEDHEDMDKCREELEELFR